MGQLLIAKPAVPSPLANPQANRVIKRLEKTSVNPLGPMMPSAGGAPGKPKGGKNLAPSVGKPNSKKNKARRAAAHDAGQPPRRAKS